MFPVLFAFDPITITTIGVLLIFSFFLGGFFIWRRAKQEHIEDGDIFDLIFLSSFIGLVGARVGYIISHFAEFGISVRNWIDPVGSHGISWFGFLIGFMIGVALICNRKKWEYFEIADMAVVGVIVSQILLRIGQFFDSSFVGANTNLPWGLPFPGFDGRQHPLSLYEIPFLFFLIWLVRYFDKHYRLYTWYCNGRSDAKPGFLWLSYLFFLSLFHIFLDFTLIRQPILFFFSFRQILLLGMLLITIFLFWKQTGNEFSLKPNKTNSQKLAPTTIKDDNNLIATTALTSSTADLKDNTNHNNNLTSASGKRFFRSRK